MKRKISLLLIIVIALLSISACSNKDTKTTTQENKTKVEEKVETEEVPEINMVWAKNMHTGIPYLPIYRPEEFKEKGIYLNKLSEDRFELIEDGKKVAIINQIPLKSGTSDALMIQGQLDVAIGSNLSTIISIDQGLEAKILSPLQTGGMCLVFPPDSDIYGWEEVKKHILSSEEPFKIGYHPPIAAPRIVFEHALREQGIKITEDATDYDADVLLVDLKGGGNFLPSLEGGHVDAWVSTTPTPELAEAGGLGKVVLKLEDYPPAGKWKDSPCCVFSATDVAIEKYPKQLKALIRLLNESCNYFETNREDAVKILGEVTGAGEEVVSLSNVKYSTEPSEEWIGAITVYVEALNKMDKLSGKLAGKSFEEVSKEVFDFRFLEEVRGE